jgi:hypothetical protein
MMKGISTAQLRKWVLVGLGVGALVSLLSGILLTGDWGGLLLNVGAELGGALATYVLLELFIRRREEEEVKKANLIAQMGSRVNDVAVAAAEELRRRGSLTDGSLQGVDLTGANLEGADLSRANLEGVRLEFARLQRANLYGANLKRVNLYVAQLQGANLEEANLEGAFMVYANLEEARLCEANLRGADLTRAKVQGANFSVVVGYSPDGTQTTSYVILPDGTKWTPDTDMARFTDPDHPDFWRPGE